MDDCKFCGGALARDNTTGICYACRIYLNDSEKMDTDWLLASVNSPTPYMQAQHIAINGVHISLPDFERRGGIAESVPDYSTYTDAQFQRVLCEVFTAHCSIPHGADFAVCAYPYCRAASAEERRRGWSGDL